MVFLAKFYFLGYYRSLPRHTTPIDLHRHFAQYGEVIESKIIMDEESRSKGYGFVSFSDTKIADRVLDMGHIYFQNKRITVASAIRKKHPDEL